MASQRKKFIYNSDKPEIPRSTRSRAKRRILEPACESIDRGCFGFDKVEPVVYSTEKNESTNFSSGNDERNLPPSEPSLLYPHSKITESEADLLLVGFIAKNKLSRLVSSQLLQLINLFVPKDFVLHFNIDHLKKKIPNQDSITTTHFYCTNCKEYLKNEDEYVCEGCASKFSETDLLRTGSYFFYFDIKTQLEILLQHEDLGRKLFKNLTKRTATKDFSVIKDIPDGRLYKKLELKDFDISCIFNTDGVPVFKSSKYSIWPILLSIIELDYVDRRRNVLTLALWFGTSKPNFNTFFRPFIYLAKKLASTEYIFWNSNGRAIKSHLYFPICVADSPARCQCQCTKQYNGAYGCSWCLLKGQSFSEEDGSYKKWVYPSIDSAPLLRKKDEFIAHLNEFRSRLDAGENVTSFYGIKSASQLLLLPKFDIVNGFVFDLMHASFLGVARTFLRIWTESKYHSCDFYIGKSIKQINRTLATFSVPSNFSRNVRSLDDLKFWKASEFNTWTLISGVVTTGILPITYAKHFQLFVHSMYLLQNEVVTPEDILNANTMLTRFVNEVSTLYGIEFCSFNCHSLTHASSCVEYWGPLYQYSAFQFENFNGLLLDIVTGTHHIGREISNKLNEWLKLEKFANSLPKTGATEYFYSLKKGGKHRKRIINIEDILLLGNPKTKFATTGERKSLEKEGIFLSYFSCFSSCIVGGYLFTTHKQKSQKQCDYIAEVNGDFFLINQIILAKSTPICFAQKLSVNKLDSGNFLFKVSRILKEIVLLKASALTSKFIVQRAGSSIEMIVKVPNASMLTE